MKQPQHMVESYKFWDIATLWARERLEHDVVIARALARGIIVDGLRAESVDAKWLKSDSSLRGYPYVGYSTDPKSPPVLLRAEALEHLLAVVRTAVVPSREILTAEFVRREDFRAWLQATGQPFPSFWFAREEV